NNLSNKIISQYNYKGDLYPKNRILILDEIQYLENSSEILDALYKQKLFPFIIIISSSENYARTLTFKKTSFKLNPFSFEEFLLAIGDGWYVDTIINHYNSNKILPTIVHQELLDLHSLYIKIGGYPTSINEYLNLSSTINVPSIHKTINNKLISDFSLNQQEQDGSTLKINQVYNSITKQLMKENKKFQYNIIRKGTTQNYFNDAIKDLVDDGYLLLANKINSDHPSTSFKLYYSDVGLLNTEIISSDFKDFNNEIYEKTLLENYIAQVLYNKEYDLMFWESDSIAKIDYIIKKDDMFIPIEIHLGTYTRSKNVSVFKKEYNIPYSIKLSSKNFGLIKGVKYVPYYAAFCI
ncbi:MAG TPA: ATP-binding protein, partial [Clostridiales bacterium]|nr:ATP-binding protein [Clostridiales bacterium]